MQYIVLKFKLGRFARGLNAICYTIDPERIHMLLLIYIPHNP